MPSYSIRFKEGIVKNLTEGSIKSINVVYLLYLYMYRTHIVMIKDGFLMRSERKQDDPHTQV